MGVFLAALSALMYGSGDFLGGLAARRIPAVLVALVSQVIGMAALAVVVAFWPAGDPSTADLVWGAIGGIGGGLGLATFYRALGAGPMSVVAPVTAVTSAVVPLLVGVATGERPSVLGWVGVIMALPAIALVSTATDEPGGTRIERPILVAALGAGAAFGLFFVAFGQARATAELWPLVAARAASITVLVGLATATRSAWRATGRPPLRSAGVVIAAAGITDTAANGVYLFSTHGELLSVAAVVAAMYPASTVLLARARLEERLLRPQVVGLALAAVALALVAVGRAT